MDKQADQRSSNAIGTFVKASTALEVLLAVVVVIPLTLWLAWARRPGMVEPAVLTLFCLSFAWGNVSMLRLRRSLRKLGYSSPGKLAFGLGPRPEDPDEFDTWQRGTHFRYSFIAVALCMLAFAVTKWLNGE